jgi:hypothetical protein
MTSSSGNIRTDLRSVDRAGRTRPRRAAGRSEIITTIPPVARHFPSATGRPIATGVRAGERFLPRLGLEHGPGAHILSGLMAALEDARDRTKELRGRLALLTESL